MAFNIALISYFALLITLSSARRDVEYKYKCRLEDTQCLTSQAAEILPLFLEGNDDLGIDRLDKMIITVEQVTDDFSYKFVDVLTTGLKNAVIDRLSIDTTFNVARLVFHTTINFNIPYLKTEGSLFSLPFTTEGSGNITASDIYFDLVIPFDIIKNSDGKDILSLKEYQFGYSIYDKITLDLTFADPKLNTPEAKYFLNDVWRLIARLYAVRFYDAICSKIFEALKINTLVYSLSYLTAYEDSWY